MSRTVTVSVSARGALATGLVVVALLASYLVGAAVGAAPPPAEAATAVEPPPTAEERRTLRVVGTGEAIVVPDQLTFSLSVTSKRPQLDAALAGSSGTLRRVLAALREQGVRGADVQTSGLQMHPEYDYPSYAPPVLTGYRVTQRAQVKVQELGQGGEAVAAAIEAGGNAVRVTDIRLGVADPEAALGDARDRAVEDATGTAQRYAEATGQSLGEVLSLREAGDGSPPASAARDRWPARRSALDELAAMPLKAGRDTLAVSVEVVWAFE